MQNRSRGITHWFKGSNIENGIQSSTALHAISIKLKPVLRLSPLPRALPEGEKVIVDRFGVTPRIELAAGSILRASYYFAALAASNFASMARGVAVFLLRS